MKPPPFAYAAPATVDEAVSLLGGADGARVLAGGQSLVPLMSAHLERPSALVDINRIAELAELDANGDVIGGRRRPRRPARPGRRGPRAAGGARRRRRPGRPSGGPQPRDRRRQPRVRRPGEQPPGGRRRARRRADRSLDRGRAHDRGGGLLPRGARRPPSSPASCCAPCASRGCPRAPAARTTRSSRAHAADGASRAPPPRCGWPPTAPIAGARVALGGVTDVPRRMSAAETSLVGAEPGDAAFAAAGAAARDAVAAPRSDMHATAELPAAAGRPSWSPGPCGRRAPARMGGRDGRRRSGAIELTVNGRRRHAAVEPRRLLSDCLREDLGLTGTNLGCEQGVCGSCTVMRRRRDACARA